MLSFTGRGEADNMLTSSGGREGCDIFFSSFQMSHIMILKQCLSYHRIITMVHILQFYILKRNVDELSKPGLGQLI